MGVGQSHEVFHICQGLCYCDPSSNHVYTPADLVHAHAWYFNSPGFVFPELRNTEDGVPALKQKADLAICLSGGGMRAAVASHGYVRGLHILGVLSQARYMNANSGSAWFSSPFSYQEMYSTDDFLGEYIDPQNLTLEKAAQQTEGSFDTIVANGNFLIGNLLRKLTMDNLKCNPDATQYRQWEDALGDMFLAPVKLNDADSCFALSGREANAEAAGVPNIYTACRDPSMPFPIVTACVIEPDRVSKRATPFVSFEYTPLYSGVPTRVVDSDFKLGGVLVESFAVCSGSPYECTLANNKHHVKLDVKWTTPVAQAMGDSSQFLAMAMNSENPWIWDVMGCPEMYCWNGIDHGEKKVQMTDGGGSDNLAIYPALRRGVKKLIICSALAVPVSKTWAQDEFDISGYFGAYPDGQTFSYAALDITSDVWNRSSQVFERRKWDELYGRLMWLTNAGHPLVIPMRLTVLPNKEQNIKGGYEVDTVWVFNGKPSKWWEALPEETKDYIDEHFSQWPIVNTYIVDYDQETASLLSNSCTWQILQASQAIQAMLTRSIL